MPGPIRPMRARDRHQPHRAATWLEPAFDLEAGAMIGAGGAAWLDLAGGHAKVSHDEAAVWLGAPVALYHHVLWFVRDRCLSRGRRGRALPVMSLAVLPASLWVAPPVALVLLLVSALFWRVPLSW